MSDDLVLDCKHHGPFNPRREVACPHCMVEVRAENAALRERGKEHEQFRHQHRDCNAMGVENHQLRLRLSAAEALCAKQAADASLWFFPHHASEAYLQAALRELHAAVEGSTSDQPTAVVE